MIRNGEIVDNLSLINQALKQERSGQGKSSKNDKIYPAKENDILKQKIKQKFESKLKDILNKNILGGQGAPNQKGDKKNILNDLLKGNKDDLLKKFDKLLK